MSALQWLQILGLGSLAGAIGQMARVAVGLGKLSVDPARGGSSLSESIEPSRLLISIAIGSTAGALTALFGGFNVTDISPEQVAGLAAAGYAGADAIEGLTLRLAGRTSSAPAARNEDDTYVG